MLHLSCCSELSAGLSCCPKMHPMTQTGPSLPGAHPQKPPGSAHRPSAPAAGPLSGPAPGGWDPGPSASSWSQPPRPALHQLPARTGTGRGGALVSAGQCRDGAHGELGTVGMTEGPSRDKLLTPQCGEKGTLGWGSGLGAPEVGFGASWSSHLSPHPPCLQGKGHSYKQEHFLCSSMEN